MKRSSRDQRLVQMGQRIGELERALQAVLATGNVVIRAWDYDQLPDWSCFRDFRDALLAAAPMVDLPPAPNIEPPGLSDDAEGAA